MRALICAALLALAPTLTLSQTAVPIGGALQGNNAAVWGRLVELAGGPGQRFVVFATASSVPDSSAAWAVEVLQRHGAVAEHIPVAPRLPGIDIDEAVRDPRWIAKVRNARGVYFSGGDQGRIVDTLLPDGKPTPLLEAIWDVYRRGGVIAGSSAGAAIMSATMFRDAPDILGVLKGTLRDGQEFDRGLGFVGPAVFVDQHFLRRGRFGRMLPLMVAKGYKIGLGVGENSAVVVQGDEVEVIGERGALVIDLHDASSVAGDVFNVRNARLSYLDHGDRYHLGRRNVTPSATKRAQPAIDPNAAGFTPRASSDPFYLDMMGDSTIADAMAHLIVNARREIHGLAFEPKPAPSDPAPDLGFEFRLHKGADSLGWFASDRPGSHMTVAHLYLDVTPVRIARPLYTHWLP